VISAIDGGSFGLSDSASSSPGAPDAFTAEPAAAPADPSLDASTGNDGPEQDAPMSDAVDDPVDQGNE
jgi:hypothetical protein